MLIDIGDPVRNLVLNACFYGISLITIVSLIPWPLGGGRSRWTFYLPLFGAGIYAVYEITMPPNWDIRLDLLLIIPMGIVIALAWLLRVVISRRRNTVANHDA